MHYRGETGKSSLSLDTVIYYRMFSWHSGRHSMSQNTAPYVQPCNLPSLTTILGRYCKINPCSETET